MVNIFKQFIDFMKGAYDMGVAGDYTAFHDLNEAVQSTLLDILLKITKGVYELPDYVNYRDIKAVMSIIDRAFGLDD